MKKKLFALSMGLLLLALTACGGMAKGGSDSAASTSPSAPQEAMDMEMGYWEESGAELDVPADDAGSYGNPYSGLPANTKMIYTADLELESKEFDEASKALTQAVSDMKGYFESRSINQGGHYRSLSCTVRVPAENYLAFLDLAGEAAHVTNRSDYSEDVSEVYYDEEARLTTQRTKLARLQELLGQAENMEDIITIESAISETELEIERLTGSLRKYDSLVSYSTVNINLYEVYRLSTDEDVPLTFGQRFSSAFLAGFQNGLAALDDLVISIARNWMVLLIWAAVITAVVIFVRRWRKKKRVKQTPPAGPQVEMKTDAPDTEK